MSLRSGDPERIARFTLMGRLGSGGMGVVYLGTDEDTGRAVALKVIRSDLAAEYEFRSRFRREIDAARAVGGACTARLVDADPDAEEPWMATEHIGGQNLAQAIAARGALSGPVVVALATGLAEALTAIHSAGIVHRDLKPGNVILSGDGPKVIDFGIAAAVDATVATRTGVLMGSPGYMAPEQVTGLEEIGPPADVFAWGLTVLFAASGRHPFGTGRADVLLYRVVHDEADTRAVPPILRSAVCAALLKEPAARPRSDALLQVLLGCTDDPEGETRRMLRDVWIPWSRANPVDDPAALAAAASSGSVLAEAASGKAASGGPAAAGRALAEAAAAEAAAAGDGAAGDGAGGAAADPSSTSSSPSMSSAALERLLSGSGIPVPGVRGTAGLQTARASSAVSAVSVVSRPSMPSLAPAARSGMRIPPGYRPLRGDYAGTGDVPTVGGYRTLSGRRGRAQRGGRQPRRTAGLAALAATLAGLAALGASQVGADPGPINTGRPAQTRVVGTLPGGAGSQAARPGAASSGPGGPVSVPRRPALAVTPTVGPATPGSSIAAFRGEVGQFTQAEAFDDFIATHDTQIVLLDTTTRAAGNERLFHPGSGPGAAEEPNFTLFAACATVAAAGSVLSSASASPSAASSSVTSSSAASRSAASRSAIVTSTSTPISTSASPECTGTRYRLAELAGSGASFDRAGGFYRLRGYFQVRIGPPDRQGLGAVTLRAVNVEDLPG